MPAPSIPKMTRASTLPCSRLGADRSLVEKGWHVVRAIGVLAKLDHGEVTSVFLGGTSLSKGWGLIKRFSDAEGCRRLRARCTADIF
jgi:hypothetical protein